MNKIDFILLFDVTDANPNGDPDAGNFPRTDAETNHGLVTDVCLKRKIRNFVQLTKDGESGYEIYVKEKAVLTNQQKKAYVNGASDAETAKKWMCRNFFDIRAFGAVMSLKEANCGQVRGPVQLSFARSIDPIIQQEFAITRCAVATEKEAKDQNGDNRTMGRKFTIPYALYTAKGTINPFLAEQTGFSEPDLAVLIQSLTHLFEFDASAARPAGSMAVRKLILFTHDSKLGNAPAHKLYESLSITRKDNMEFPRSIADYDIVLNTEAIPAGVTVKCIDC
ncbi:MAG: type I-C CRISPR-associated protein Cas7/Csd2 [Akkermansia sp.]|nr:type I-C CRISPR-associated protein Cas7/Csd2 [Akkermansia sp.]